MRKEMEQSLAELREEMTHTLDEKERRMLANLNECELEMIKSLIPVQDEDEETLSTCTHAFMHGVA